MAFFEEQARARSRSTRPILLVGLALLILMAIVSGVLVGLLKLHATGASESTPQFWHRAIPLLVTGSAGALLVSIVAMIGRFRQLHRGGQIMAQLLGGRQLLTEAAHPAERGALAMSQELAIAIGIPAPQVFVLDDEACINALACGVDSSDLVLVLTRGAIEQLSRDEMRAVLAQGISAALVCPQRLDLRLTGLIHGLMAWSIMGIGLLQGLRRMRHVAAADRSRIGAAGFLFFATIAGILSLIGLPGLLLGQCVQIATARSNAGRRDLAAVSLARCGPGLASALGKIASSPQGARMQNALTMDLAHLMLADPRGGLPTHPPLAQRIRRLDPNDATNMPSLPQVGSAPSRPRVPTIAAQIVERVGQPQLRDLQKSIAILSEIPADLRLQSGDLFGARAVIVALLVSREQPTRGQQLALLEQWDPPLARQARQLRLSIQIIGDAHRLPLATLCIPTLRMLSAAQRQAFAQLLRKLILSDRTLLLFELLLHHVVDQSLRDPMQRHPQPDSIADLQPLADDIAITISAMALSGPRSPESAYQSAMSRLPLRPMPRLVDRIDIKKLEESLQILTRATPGVKKRLLETAAWCVVEGRSISRAESELLRAFALILDAPLPAMFAGK